MRISYRILSRFTVLALLATLIAILFSGCAGTNTKKKEIPLEIGYYPAKVLADNYKSSDSVVFDLRAKQNRYYASIEGARVADVDGVKRVKDYTSLKIFVLCNSENAENENNTCANVKTALEATYKPNYYQNFHIIDANNMTIVNFVSHGGNVTITPGFLPNIEMPEYVDVRNKYEYFNESIADAVNLYYREIDNNILFLNDDKYTSEVIFCLQKSCENVTRSVVDKMRNVGYQNIFLLNGDKEELQKYNVTLTHGHYHSNVIGIKFDIVPGMVDYTWFSKFGTLANPPVTRVFVVNSSVDAPPSAHTINNNAIFTEVDCPSAIRQLPQAPFVLISPNGLDAGEMFHKLKDICHYNYYDKIGYYNGGYNLNPKTRQLELK